MFKPEKKVGFWRKRREIPSNQQTMRRLKKEYAQNVAQLAQVEPGFQLRLKNMFLGTDLEQGYTVEKILNILLTDEGLTVAEVLASPLLRALIEPVPIQGRSEKLQELRENTASKEDVVEFVNEHKLFLISGFRSAVSLFEVVPELPPEELLRRKSQALRQYRQNNPERHKQNSQLGVEAAAKAAKPKRFTDEVVHFLQDQFDEGKKYAEAVELLNAAIAAGKVDASDIEGEPRFTVRQVREAVSDGKLEYTLQGMRQERLQDLEAEIIKVFQRTGKTRQVQQHFDGRYKPDYIARLMAKLELHERVPWEQEVVVQGAAVSLETTLRQFLLEPPADVASLLSNPDLKYAEEHQLFMEFLEQNGVRIGISVDAYRNKRQRLVGKK